MAISSNELLFYKSEVVGDGADNGGRMSTNLVAAGVKNNVWADIPQAERTAGSTKYRKTFLKVSNDADIKLVAPRLFVDLPTPGDDRVLIFPGTQTDTQANLSGSERLYGAGTLDANVVSGATSLAVNVEAAADNIFRNGDLIRVSDKTSNTDLTGNVDFIRLAATGGVSWNGNKATLTFAAGQSLAVGYQASTTRVASVIEPADVQATWDNWTGASALGTYDGKVPTLNPTTIKPIMDWIGTVEQTWTITFTSASNFVCVGDVVGSVGGGNISADFAPNNSSFSKPFFTLPFSGWGGTWASGDIVTFKTHPAAIPIWQKRIVPANASSLSANKVIIGVTGESA